MLHLYYSSEAVMRFDYQKLLKSPPLASMAGSDPVYTAHSASEGFCLGEGNSGLFHG